MIGIFDSGFGGSYIIDKIINKLPEYDYVHLSDNARAPYGPHSKETILKYSKQAVDFLSKEGATLIIFACFTVSALALRSIQSDYIRKKNIKGKNILGILKPVVEKANELSKTNKIGVVGTKASIESNVFEIELKKLNKQNKVYQKSCPLLVPFIEEGWHNKPEAKMVLKKYLRPLKSYNVDSLILGCTHYPYMIKDFIRIMGKNTQILDPGVIEADSLKDYLERHPEIESKLTKKGKRQFYVTESPDKILDFYKNFTKLKIKKVKKIELS